MRGLWKHQWQGKPRINPKRAADRLDRINRLVKKAHKHEDEAKGARKRERARGRTRDEHDDRALVWGPSV